MIKISVFAKILCRRKSREPARGGKSELTVTLTGRSNNECKVEPFIKKAAVPVGAASFKNPYLHCLSFKNF